MSYRPPNYTQTPNEFFDETLLKIDSMSELKVVLAIIRQTFGWHRGEDRISLTRFQQLTGLSRQAVIDGVRSAERHGIIAGRQVGQHIFYRLLVNDLDQLPIDDQSKVLTSSALELVNNLDTQKKEKETKKKEDKRNRFISGKYAEDIKH